MEYRALSNTGLQVSKLCLGTMTWGQQNSQDEAFEQLDYAVEQGINFIDTAEMYPVPPMPETQGRTEEYIGNWLAARGGRDKLVLASKAVGPATWTAHIQNGEIPRFHRRHLEGALQRSLQRLQTDYLDLYQLHWPDRNTNYFGELGYSHQADEAFTPIEETLEVLDGFVRDGRVRHIGLSNETPWGLMEFVRIAEQRGWPRIVSIQNPYNLLNRSFEIGLAECSHRENVGLLAYSPLAFGVLSGKYLGGQWPEGARITLFKRFSRYTNPQATAATQAYCELAAEHGLDACQMALAYVSSRSFVTSNIIGATSMSQLKSNIASHDLSLGDDLLAALEAIHVQHPNPAP